MAYTQFQPNYSTPGTTDVTTVTIGASETRCTIHMDNSRDLAVEASVTPANSSGSHKYFHGRVPRSGVILEGLNASDVVEIYAKRCPATADGGNPFVYAETS